MVQQPYFLLSVVDSALRVFRIFFERMLK